MKRRIRGGKWGLFSACVLLSLGVYSSLMSSPLLVWGAIQYWNILTALSLVSVIFLHYTRFPETFFGFTARMSSLRFFQPLEHDCVNKKPPIAFSTLFIAQIGFLLITFVFFYGIGLQAQWNPRVQGWESGSLFSVMQKQSILLVWSPWLTYTVVGICLAWGVRYPGAVLHLPRLISARVPYRLRAFTYAYVTAAIRGSMIIACCLALMSACLLGWETILVGLGGLPVATTPMCAAAVCFFVGLFCKNRQPWIAQKLFERGMTIGAVWISYLLFFSVIFLWVYLFINQVPIPGLAVSPEATGGASLGEKSPLVGMFTSEQLWTRQTFLIWSWWGIWCVPMAYFLYHWARGRSLGRVFFWSLVLPSILVAYGTVCSESVERLLKEGGSGGGHALLVLLAFSAIYFALRWAARFPLMATGFLSTYPTAQISTLFFLMYFPAYFLFSWVSLQVLLTCAVLFLSPVLLGTLVCLLCRRTTHSAAQPSIKVTQSSIN